MNFSKWSAVIIVSINVLFPLIAVFAYSCGRFINVPSTLWVSLLLISSLSKNGVYSESKVMYGVVLSKDIL